MAEDTSTPPQDSGGPPKSKMPLMGAVIAGLLIGGAGGTLAAGPIIAKRSAAASAAPVAAAEGHGKEGAEKAGGARAMHIIDNVVLNPAHSGGTRFLVLSAAFEMQDQGIVDEMKARDAEVRDIVLRVIGRKTVDELSDPTMREPLKAELAAAIDSLVGKKAVRRLYFPQFVIQ